MTTHLKIHSSFSSEGKQVDFMVLMSWNSLCGEARTTFSFHYLSDKVECVQSGHGHYPLEKPQGLELLVAAIDYHLFFRFTSYPPILLSNFELQKENCHFHCLSEPSERR